MEHLLEPTNLLNLLTLTFLEIILGVDNVIFIALIVERLPFHLRNKIRISGLSLALILRILMLFGASWIISLKEPLTYIFNFPLSGRTLLLLIGGIFLIYKTFTEIRSLYKENANTNNPTSVKNSFVNAVLQIIFIDLVLSFDSIITAVGVSNDLPTIVTAIVISMLIMLASSKSIGGFIERNPSVKVIALCFIGMVGAILIANGLDIEIPKGYLYFAVFFSVLTETINITLKKKLGK
ncbi:MAG: TerC family protein [Alphaproteobacteria bacterium]